MNLLLSKKKKKKIVKTQTSGQLAVIHQAAVDMVVKQHHHHHQQPKKKSIKFVQNMYRLRNRVIQLIVQFGMFAFVCLFVYVFIVGTSKTNEREDFF